MRKVVHMESRRRHRVADSQSAGHCYRRSDIYWISNPVLSLFQRKKKIGARIASISRTYRSKPLIVSRGW